MEEIHLSMKSVCKPLQPGDVVFPMRRNFTSHVSLCQRMRGQTRVVQCEVMQQTLLEEVKKYNDSCGDPKEGEGML